MCVCAHELQVPLESRREPASSTLELEAAVSCLYGCWEGSFRCAVDVLDP